MLNRTSISEINSIIQKNPEWKVLDIGCGYRAHPQATVIADVQDFSNFYKEKKFIQVKTEALPFKDKEFDFVIASHVIEHTKDFEFFIKELERITNKGYIELPTRLGDNLVFENQTDHIWWFSYNDTIKSLIASRKNQLIDSFITVSMAKLFENVFRESFVLELIWEDKINYKVDNSLRFENFEKISFLKIVKKYISKKIRSFFK